MQMIYDPRRYTVAYPQSNIIIKQALQVQDNLLTREDLIATLTKSLEHEHDALINVALNLSPSFAITKIIWDNLNTAINSSADELSTSQLNTQSYKTYANIFAIPIVLVAGSKNKTQLINQLNVDELNKFMQDKQIFKLKADTFISGLLVEPNSIANLKPSQLYHWARHIKTASSWLPIEMSAQSVEVLNDGVFLRFLIGVSINKDSGINELAYTKYSMEFMRLINSQLKVDGVTLFPIPFPIVPLSRAFSIGNNYRIEVAIQVAISNIVRKIREARLTPFATIKTVDAAVEITINSRELSNLSEISRWAINHIDDFDKIHTTIIELMKDIGIEFNYAPAIN